MAIRKKETFAESMSRLEKIVAQIDNHELDIDMLVDKIKEATELVTFCTRQLTKAEDEVEKLLAEKPESKE